MEHRVSGEQIDMLLEYLGSHRNLARGSGGLGMRSKEQVEKMWEDLAVRLNSLGTGSSKNGLRWKRYWIDLKHKVKARVSKLNKQMSGTGGGPSDEKDLSEIDLKVLSIIGEEAVTGDTQYRVPAFDIESTTQPPPDARELTPIRDPEPSTSFDISLNSPSRRGQIPNIKKQKAKSPSPPYTIKKDTTKKNSSVCRIDSTTIMELESRRVAAEEKLAEAAMIQAEAARTMAQAMLLLAELIKEK